MVEYIATIYLSPYLDVLLDFLILFPSFSTRMICKAHIWAHRWQWKLKHMPRGKKYRLRIQIYLLCSCWTYGTLLSLFINKVNMYNHEVRNSISCKYCIWYHPLVLLLYSFLTPYGSNGSTLWTNENLWYLWLWNKKTIRVPI